MCMQMCNSMFTVKVTALYTYTYSEFSGKMKTKQNLNVGTFNVRGLSQEVKQHELKRDMVKYGVDICALQETKIKNGTDKIIEGYRLLSLETNQKAYGNGFMISPKYSEHIHRYWKVSDRISVLQLALNSTSNNGTQQKQYRSTLQGMKMQIQRKPPQHMLTIINVYAPTTQRLRNNMKELEEMYSQLSNLVNNINNLSSSLLFIAGDLNAKVGMPTGLEKCLGKFSRGRRNNSGESLVNFCDMNNLFVSNSGFQHPARHITTCTAPYKDKTTNKIIYSYTQIDYIILPQNKKQILTDARSYAGTEVNSDHRLVIARMETDLYKIYKIKNTNASIVKRYNTCKLVEDMQTRKEYQDILKDKCNEVPVSENRWNRLKSIITDTAKEKVGYQQPRRQDNKIHDNEIEQLSIMSRNIRIQQHNTNNPEEVRRLKTMRNQNSHTMRQNIKQKQEQRIKAVINDIENAESDHQMFTAVKNINRKAQKDLSVHDSEGKIVTTPNEVHKLITEHFNNHFNKENTNAITPFIGDPKKMKRPITKEEVQTATKTMTNNRAPGFDNISVELIKYAPTEIYNEISEILTEAIETHKHNIDTGKGQITPLEKPQKPMPGPVKNLRPITLLTVLRKTLSKIALRRLKPKFEQYLSPSQSAYRPNRSTTDIVWAYRWILAKIQSHNITVYSTGIDMSAAFDTIDRNHLLQTLQTFADEDEMRMVRFLLSNTTLQVRMRGATAESTFTSNVGSPQGDSLSGPLFNIYFERALQDLREAMKDPPQLDHNYTITSDNYGNPNEHDHDYTTTTTSLPEEMIYADDADFLTTTKRKQDKINEISHKILRKHNLQENVDKTELITLKRGKRDRDMENSYKIRIFIRRC